MHKISVLMPVYNAESFVKKAIESILNQTLRDFEFLIINDGSTDSTLNCINSYKDSRIKLISNSINLGLIKSLNIGIEIATGEIISRMDADDIAHPKRLEYIKDFMDNNPNVTVCGTWFNTTTLRINNKKYNSDQIKTRFLFDCAISAATFRRNYFIDNDIRYSEKFPHAEDYELWTRLVFNVEFALITKCLLTLTLHENQVSKKFGIIQQNSMERALVILLNKIGIEPTNEEIMLHFQILHDLFPCNSDFVKKTEDWLKKLIYYNSKTKFISDKNFRKIINDEWFGILTHLSSNNIYTLYFLNNSSITNISSISKVSLMKFYLKNYLIKIRNFINLRKLNYLYFF